MQHIPVALAQKTQLTYTLPLSKSLFPEKLMPRLQSVASKWRLYMVATSDDPTITRAHSLTVIRFPGRGDGQCDVTWKLEKNKKLPTNNHVNATSKHKFCCIFSYLYPNTSYWRKVLCLIDMLPMRVTTCNIYLFLMINLASLAEQQFYGSFMAVLSSNH